MAFNLNPFRKSKDPGIPPSPSEKFASDRLATASETGLTDQEPFNAARELLTFTLAEKRVERGEFLQVAFEKARTTTSPSFQDVLDFTTAIRSNVKQRVRSYVNPNEMNFSQPRITQKVQTASPTRFVVQDWGPDLLTISITTKTGNLLRLDPGSRFLSTLEDLKPPTDVSPRRFRFFSRHAPKPETPTPASVSGSITKNIIDVHNSVVAEGERINFEDFNSRALQGGGNLFNPSRENRSISQIMEATGLSEILGRSIPHQALMALNSMYENFDSDTEILFLEYGPTRLYRGYINSFGFTQMATSPWNWPVTISFVVLETIFAPNKNLVSGSENFANQHIEDFVITPTARDFEEAVERTESQL